MRMWCVDPKQMCRNHLLGEHLECHMFATTLKKGVHVDGYVKNGLLDISRLQARHQELVNEMLRRGYRHNTPFPEENSYTIEPNLWLVKLGKVDPIISEAKLRSRCLNCFLNKEV
jgi:hypothetical protein